MGFTRAEQVFCEGKINSEESFLCFMNLKLRLMIAHTMKSFF